MLIQDKNENEWDLTITVGTALKLKEALGIDLIGGSISEIVQKIVMEPLTRINIIWLICKEKAKQQNIEEIDFWELIGPDQVQPFNNGLKESIVNFLQAQRPESASDIAAGISAFGEILNHQSKIQTAALKDPEIQKGMDKLTETALKKCREEIGKLSSKWEGQLDDQLNHTHSGN